MDQFMILFKKDNDDTLYALDFNWIRLGWTQSKRDEHAMPDHLDEYGRRVILQHFGLGASPLAPSLADIRMMLPSWLIELRRMDEGGYDRKPVDPFNYLDREDAEPLELLGDERRLIAA